ncbi:MAG: WYL domain-containing protein [Bacteroidetes bacterium]|nr:WYL domain-containing protein [Bacteroidota bacterium]
MPVNRNALIRYKTIDRCLQNRYRKWTLEDLIEACSDALYEYEGIDKGVSRRTVQADIQLMRSDKLGYNAPIAVVDKRYYTYSDSSYSITNIPLTENDLSKLSEAVEFLKQFQGFTQFRELDTMVSKLEDHIYAQRSSTRPVIDFEKNTDLKGLEFLDELYHAIINKHTVSLTYQSFQARDKSKFDFHPYLLKEFRNRWFVIGKKTAKGKILNLALDRIHAVDRSHEDYAEPDNFNPDLYFRDVIGVTVSENLRPVNVVLRITNKHAPYILTKPLHSSQKLIERTDSGTIISLRVQHNFELEKEILSYGEQIEVILPLKLRHMIGSRLAEAQKPYGN